MSKIALNRQQADYLRALQTEAVRAQESFAVALNALGLAVERNPTVPHEVSFDFGMEPWIEVKPREAA